MLPASPRHTRRSDSVGRRGSSSTDATGAAAVAGTNSTNGQGDVDSEAGGPSRSDSTPGDTDPSTADAGAADDEGDADGGAMAAFERVVDGADEQYFNYSFKAEDVSSAIADLLNHYARLNSEKWMDL